ncbi:MAG TPA: hypothetical protein VM431_09020 [Phycisphaerae bacterium]|nr:hypothetical protein [Phycisphaerae bacterium]
MSRIDSTQRAGWRGTLLMGLAIVVALAVVVHPLRRYVVEPRRQALLGGHELPGRRLALASQFGFATVSGASVRLVPGRPALELGDLPMQAVTLILGGFRGPYVVWLWINVEEEKHRKVHFDLMDRYTKIAALQSDYPQMWTIHAWNMAYNISAQWQSLERKYQWIRRAVEFLHEGYRLNPHSADIMAQMGHIYSHKLGRSQEAAYFRRRVREDEGRSAFLIAYEWFDAARRADDQYGTLQHSLGKAATFSQACHSLTFYAQELTQGAYDAFAASVEARQAGRDAEARRAYDAGCRQLADAAGAWVWAQREWYDHTIRFEKEQAPTMLLNIYKRFHNEAAEAADQMESLRKDLTYDNLPEQLQQMHRPEIK